MTKVVAIIQARTGSTRLPGKVLQPILGKPTLERMIERVKRAKLIDHIIVATTTNPIDYPIVQLTNSLGISSFRGSETNVLDRFYQATKKYHSDIIVRLTADCPLTDPLLIDDAIATLIKTKSDYIANRSITQQVPSGFDVEAFTFSALKKTYLHARLAYDLEHVTPYIYNHPKMFKSASTSSSTYFPLPHPHLSVDTQADLNKIRLIFAQLYPHNPNFTIKDVALVVNQKKL